MILRNLKPIDINQLIITILLSFIITGLTCHEDTCNLPGGGGTPNVDIEIISPEEMEVLNVSADDEEFEITIERNDNEELITMEVTQMPVGIDYFFEPLVLESNQSVTSLMLSNLLTLSEGEHQIVICANAPGQQVCRSFIINVIPGFSVEVLPNPVSVEQGTIDTVTVNVVRNRGFSGEVNLFIIDEPSPGFQSDWLQTGGDSRDLKIEISPTVEIGTYTYEVGGSADIGNFTFINYQTTLDVDVTGAPLSQWIDVTPDPSPPLLYDVDFGKDLDDNVFGITVGANGTMLKTTDLGVFWNYISSGTSETLNGVDFTSWTDNGCAVGNNGTILRTTNGGFTWDNLSGSVGTDVDLFNVQVIWPEIWIVGSRSGRAYAYLSTDRGDSWESKINSSFAAFWGVSFADDELDHGVLVGNSVGRVIVASDSGNTWEVIFISNTFSWLQDVFLNNSQFGWACGHAGTLLHTTDGGYNWVSQIEGIQSNLRSIEFDGAGVFAVGDGGTILRKWIGSPWELEDTGIPDFGIQNLWGVALTDFSRVAVGGNNLGGVIIKRRQ